MNDENFEFYYDTSKISLGRNLKSWTRDDKISELNKLLIEFKSGGSKKKKTYNLMEEIFQVLGVKRNMTNDEIISYKKLTSAVYTYIEQEDGSPMYPFSEEIELDGINAIEKLVANHINWDSAN